MPSSNPYDKHIIIYTHYLPGLRFRIWWARKNRCNPNRIQILQILTQGDFMPELGFVGFRLGFANPRFELRQLMGVSQSSLPNYLNARRVHARELRFYKGSVGLMHVFRSYLEFTCLHFLYKSELACVHAACI